MDSRPVGIFDSGFGGLTALMEFRRLMPNENILFFGDNGRAPYGAKTREGIKEGTKNIVDFLVNSGCKAVLAACGTISLNAGDVVASAAVPSCNVLTPSVKYIASLNDDAPFGIIATAASVKSKGYETELTKAGVTREIISVPCPDFVTLIEAGVPWTDGRVKAAVEEYLRPIKEAGATALLLGCTHYGIIEPAIREYMGEKTEIISASACGARYLADTVKEKGIEGGNGQSRLVTSGDPAEFRKTASIILGYDTGDVESIPEW